MKKLFVLFLVLGLLTGSFASLAEGSVVLYYSHATDWTDPLLREFQEETGIKVEAVGLGTGELISRIIAESANPQADILWGGVAESYVPIAEYLASYKSTEIDSLYPGSYDAENYIWTAFDIEPMVMIYNTEMIPKDEAPTSWADLLNEKWKGKIASADPLKSSSAFAVIMGIVGAYGQEDGGGFEFLEKFVPQLDGKILSSSSGTYKGVDAQEYAIGLTYEEAALRYIAAGSKMGIVYPSEGTNINYSPVAIVKGAPNLENAQKFVDFVLSKKTQDKLAQINRRSSRMDVELPEFFVPFSQIPSANASMKWVIDNTEEFYTFWEDLVTK